MANLKEIKLKLGSVKNTQKLQSYEACIFCKLTRTRQLSEQAEKLCK